MEELSAVGMKIPFSWMHHLFLCIFEVFMGSEQWFAFKHSMPQYLHWKASKDGGDEKIVCHECRSLLLALLTTSATCQPGITSFHWKIAGSSSVTNRSLKIMTMNIKI